MIIKSAIDRAKSFAISGSVGSILNIFFKFSTEFLASSQASLISVLVAASSVKISSDSPATASIVDVTAVTAEYKSDLN